MSNYSQIQTRVVRRVIDLPSAVLAEVPQLVNIALKKLQQKHNFKVMEAELSAYTHVQDNTLYTAATGGSAISLPNFGGSFPVFKEWRNEPWYIQYTDGAPRFMTMAPSKESLWGAFSEKGASALDQGFPRAALEGMSDDSNNRGLSVYPLPDGASDWADGEYRITLPYYRYLADLSAAGDSNWFTNDVSGEEYIVQWAAAEAHALNWDFEKFGIMTAKADINYKEIVRTDKLFRLGSVRELVPHWRGVHSTKTRI